MPGLVGVAPSECALPAGFTLRDYIGRGAQDLVSGEDTEGIDQWSSKNGGQLANATLRPGPHPARFDKPRMTRSDLTSE
jgi:hypothetical protein